METSFKSGLRHVVSSFSSIFWGAGDVWTILTLRRSITRKRNGLLKDHDGLSLIPIRPIVIRTFGKVSVTPNKANHLMALTLTRGIAFSKRSCIPYMHKNTTIVLYKVIIFEFST